MSEIRNENVRLKLFTVILQLNYIWCGEKLVAFNHNFTDKELF